jgi:hypothetical protein
MEGMEAMSLHQEFESPVALTAEDRAAKLRQDFPECAEATAQMEALFGKCEVLSMTEGDKTKQSKYYKPDSDYLAVIDGESFLHMGKLIKLTAAAEKGVQNAKSK